MESIYLGITQDFFDKINLEILKNEAACFKGEDCKSEIDSLRATIGEYYDDEEDALKPATIVKMKGNALYTDCEVLCHQVNLFKSMGGGIARQIAMCFPDVERAYRHYDKAELGEVCFANAGDYVVANCYSQDGYETDYVALAKCFAKVNAYMDKHGFTTVAIPYHYGCGIADGDWDTVLFIISQCLIEKTLKIYKL
ncbi:MAG: macro domain-containing protein [Clostridia bacterium]|nr:macro domain-containing protein [Clostridia bacterium]